MNIVGEKLKITIFGQSHSDAIGCVVDNLEPGAEIDINALEHFLERRSPGRDDFSTPRKEADKFEILSGLIDGKTCGAPISAIIRNTNVKKGDYALTADILRPSHSDYTAFVKYSGFNDKTGGGQFSGRLTAPLCFAGGICKQLLAKRGVSINARIKSIYDITDESPWQGEALDAKFPVKDKTIAEKMQECIRSAREALDSVGGVVECIATGVEAGLGEPMFESIESQMSKNIFSIPAVKGIEFGEGFGITRMHASKANDAFVIKNGKIATATNHSGGVQGGITNGMPIVFRTAFKPTPSIAQKQRSVNIRMMKETELEIKGRHDPCVVLRAVPVVEAVCAITLYDFYIRSGK